MKKFYVFIIGLMIMFSLSSCETYTYATTQDDIYIENIDEEVDIVHSNISFDIIFTYGTPYFRNGEILYYLYNGIYYYPFYYGGYWYVRAYRRPFVYLDYKPYFRPHKYDYRFKPGRYFGYDRHHKPHMRHSNIKRHNNVLHYPHPNINHQKPNSMPNIQHQRPNRPNIMNRSSQRIDRNQNNHHGHINMGGRR